MPLSAWMTLPEGIDNPTVFLLLGGLGAALLGVAKAGFGGGIGILTVPILIYACGQRAALATGIMLPLLMACDLVAVGCWWGKWDRRSVMLILPGAVGGIIVGSVVLWSFQRLDVAGGRGMADAALKLGIGAIALMFVAFRAAAVLRKRQMAFRPVLWQGTCAGLAAGVTSTLAHAAGPITTMYFLPQNMHKSRFVASTALYYWIGNALKLPPYLLLGMVRTDTLAASVMLLPAVVGGALVGVFLHHRVGRRSFTGIVYCLLGLAGVHLCFKALVALTT